VSGSYFVRYFSFVCLYCFYLRAFFSLILMTWKQWTKAWRFSNFFTAF